MRCWDPNRLPFSSCMKRGQWVCVLTWKGWLFLPGASAQALLRDWRPEDARSEFLALKLRCSGWLGPEDGGDAQCSCRPQAASSSSTVRERERERQLRAERLKVQEKRWCSRIFRCGGAVSLVPRACIAAGRHRCSCPKLFRVHRFAAVPPSLPLYAAPAMASSTYTTTARGWFDRTGVLHAWVPPVMMDSEGG